MYGTIANIPRIYSRNIAKYGDTFTIYRDSENLSTHGLREKGRQVISPFDVNFLRFFRFAADSPIQRGDHIKNESTGEEFFVTAADVDTAISAPMSIYTELVMVNYPAVDVQRYSDPQVDEYGNPVPGSGGWQTVSSPPMTVEHITGQMAYKDGLLLPDTVFRATSQVSTDIQLNDRLVIDGKPYQVTDINTVISPGLQVVQMKTDTR